MGALVAFPGFVLNLATFVLFLLATISTPIIKAIWLLRVSLAADSNFLGIAGDVNLGTFGYCDRLSFESASLTTCSGTSYPYGIVLPSIVPETYQQTYDNIFNETAVKVAIRLTIVFPIVTGLAFLNMLLAGLAWSDRSRGFECCAFFTTFVTMILSWVAFAFLAAVAGVANNRIKSATDNYASVHMANGAWMVLAGAICMFLACIFLCLAMFGCYGSSGDSRRQRRRAEKQQMEQAYGGSYPQSGRW